MAKSQAGSAGRESEFPLLEYLDELMEELRKDAPRALKEFDEDAIHDARVATRRLKAAVDLLAPVLSGKTRKPFERALKKLRRRLGPLRDADVMLGHLDEFGRTERLRPGADWLRDRLESARSLERDKAGKKAAPAEVLSRLGTWWGVREEAAEARDAAGSLLAESLHLQLDAFAEQADLVCQRHGPHAGHDHGAGHRAGAGQAGHGGAPDPHELRIAGKALRYTLDMAREQGSRLPDGVAKAFKKMQDALGTWHDYVVLTETAMKTSADALLAHHDAARQERVLDLARAAIRRADRQLGAFSALWTRRGADLANTIRSAFPLSRSIALTNGPTEAPTQSKTDRDPPGSAETSSPPAATPDAASVA